MSDTDHAGRPVVAVTGIGLITALGAGVEQTWSALVAGRSGIRPITRFATTGLRTQFGGTVEPHGLGADTAAPDRAECMGKLVAAEAIADAGLMAEAGFPGPLFLSLPPVELEWTERRALAAGRANQGYAGLIAAAHTGGFARYGTRFLFGSVAEALCVQFGFQGAPISVSTACASGGTAIQLGVEAIRRGECAVAMVIGSDGSINPESLIRFSLLSALSTRNDDPAGAARPFAKDRDGFVMAEGAAALVLESRSHAVARGARLHGVIAGIGERADNFHRTRSSPSGAPIIDSIRRALADAALPPEAIDAVNAHGTGTPENDKMEWLGLSTVFGERIRDMPVTANKSMIGHTLTAAGAIEAVISLLMLGRGMLPPTINHHQPDPAIPIDCVPNTARSAILRRILSNSFGFGGQNVCLVITAPEPA